MQNNEPICEPGDILIPQVRQYRTDSEINTEHLLSIRSELLTIHNKIDMILEALRK